MRIAPIALKSPFSLAPWNSRVFLALATAMLICLVAASASGMTRVAAVASVVVNGTVTAPGIVAIATASATGFNKMRIKMSFLSGRAVSPPDGGNVQIRCAEDFAPARFLQNLPDMPVLYGRRSLN